MNQIKLPPPSDVQHVYVGTGLGAGRSFKAKPSEMAARSRWRKFWASPPKKP